MRGKFLRGVNSKVVKMSGQSIIFPDGRCRFGNKYKSDDGTHRTDDNSLVKFRTRLNDEHETRGTDQLQGRIDRLDAVLKKSQAADRRRRELQKNNRDINRPAKSR
jgi:hypothetical protein